MKIFTDIIVINPIYFPVRYVPLVIGCVINGYIVLVSISFGITFRKRLRVKTIPNNAMPERDISFIIVTWAPKSNALKEAGLSVKQELIWNKNSLVIGRQDYQWKHEPCLYGWKETASHNFYADRTQTTVMDFDKPLKNGEHPTMKPVGLFSYQIQNSSKKGDTVLDLFGGSGTTMIACEQLGRKSYLMEFDPKYVDVIINRWEEFTGKKAKLINKEN